MAYLKRISLAGFILLILYSITITSIEARTSQAFVRNFLTDIEGPVPFYAINTTVSVTFLAFASLIFLINVFTIYDRKKNKLRVQFYLSQFLIFGYLAFDDRFMVHERMKQHIGIEGDIVLASIGILELIALYFWGKAASLTKVQKVYIGIAAVFFFLMMAVDTVLPAEAFLRLSLEDLSKTWSVFFIYLFSWNILIQNLNFLKSEISKKNL